MKYTIEIPDLPEGYEIGGKFEDRDLELRNHPGYEIIAIDTKWSDPKQKDKYLYVIIAHAHKVKPKFRPIDPDKYLEDSPFEFGNEFSKMKFYAEFVLSEYKSWLSANQPLPTERELIDKGWIEALEWVIQCQKSWADAFEKLKELREKQCQLR